MSAAVSAPRAVVLLSGGLDSSTVLAAALAEGRECFALTVQYGQRHSAEIAAAVRIARALGVREHRCASVDLGQFGGSALTDLSIAVPEAPTTEIPITYVPARNTVMLSLALAWAEVLDADEIHLGVNAVDYSGYPDCRPAFIAAFEAMANLATKLARNAANGGDSRYGQALIYVRSIQLLYGSYRNLLAFSGLIPKRVGAPSA